MKKNTLTITNLIAPIAAFIVIFGIWHLIVLVFMIPRWVLPDPIDIFSIMVTSFNLFSSHIWVSAKTIYLGFLLGVPLGILLAALVTNFKILDATLTPYIIALVMTPLITLVPLLMLWLGFGIGVKVLAGIIQAFPIILMDSATGFNNVELNRLELMQSLGANRLQTFMRSIFPSGLPDVFTGIKMGGIFATVAVITAEFVGGNVGLGSQIIKYTQYIKTEHAYACIFFVAIIGLSLFIFTSSLEKVIIRWEE